LKNEISILISTKNRFELGYTLFSLLQQTEPEWCLDIIYGDIYSTLSDYNQSILDLIKQTHTVKTHIYPRSTNFLKNFNEVISRISNKKSMRLDDDIILCQNYIKTLDPYLDIESVGAVSGFIETMSFDFWEKICKETSSLSVRKNLLSQKYINDFNFNKGLNQPLFHRGHISPLEFSQEWYYSGTLPTDALLLLTKVFSEVKFDEKLASPHFCDDLDLSFALRKKNYKLIFSPQARCIHLHAFDKVRIHNEKIEKKLFGYIKNKWT
jgi:GT2 family glycosyltransferase